MKKLKTVFVIEDDHDTRVALRQALELAGYAVISAANGDDALQKLKSMVPPALFVLDINLPVLHGDDFLAALSKEPVLAVVPVMQISAANNPQRAGTFCALAKPIDLSQFLSHVKSAIEKADTACCD